MAPPNKQSLRTAKLALAAITELRDDGQPATTDTISQHIQEEFEVPDREVTKYLSKALEKGVAFGAIKKMNGRYYLGSVVDGIREHRRRRRSRKGGRRRRRRRSRH
ncbi:winged helix-like dna-binding domain superfamily [Holotrichia oblita]|uniref:Winged helix-like dna-binding domain superfamily n=1 Tax=Holotrichia oblita TaxID=644536 RepID=A0ACB9T2P7_HOLOL|nr:winged helix-like dna-binding domain superfamily [Holotrichia oblita]